ncbi:hypothetical protein GGX14DRAFT_356977, partial [Mycena pura]
ASGFNPHLPGRGYSLLAKGIGATMWFFIFYRLRYIFPCPFSSPRLTPVRSDKTAVNSWYARVDLCAARDLTASGSSSFPGPSWRPPPFARCQPSLNPAGGLV